MLRNSHLCLLALASILFLVPGCTPAARNVPSSPGTQTADEPPLDYVYALQLAKNWGLVTRSGMSADIYTGRQTVADEMGVTMTSNEGVFRCLYKDTPNPHISNRPMAMRPTFILFNCGGQVLKVWDAAAESKTLARAWKTMVAGIPKESPDSAAAFDALSAAYREDPAAYVMSEETRALKVQAEAGVHEKNNFAAVQRFREALSLSPWWPQGRFNLALIYSELNLYHLATIEMEKYLKLAPDAPNARAAQDKIYAWRGKLAR